MTTSEQIRALCAVSRVSLAELARRIGQTPQNLDGKLRRNTVSFDELQRIAEVLEVKYVQYFLLPDGNRIE